MKKQIILTILCLFAILVSVSAANAATLNVGSGQTYSNIQDAYDAANNSDTIFIKNGTYSGTGNNGINIYKNLTIIGESQNGTIIDAQGTDYIFSIASGYNVTISKLTLKNGSSMYGGAIYNEGALAITDATFTNNHVNEYGGAVYSTGYGSSIVLTGCTFTDNSASVDAGAVLNYYGNATITDCTFTGNDAGDDGGAICNYLGYMTINGCTFIDNSAVNYGGAVDPWYGICNITDCTFINNSAVNYGGAVSNEASGDCTIIGCTFTGNSAEYGGALLNTADLLTVSKCVFKGNDATWGGAIYNNQELNITDSTFQNNTAYVGGAIYTWAGYVNLTSSIFTNNSADNVGGAVYSYSHTLNITGCNFNKNKAALSGGAISISGEDSESSTIVKYSRFVGNTAGNASDIFFNPVSGSLDARYNWWGSNDGPEANRLAYSDWDGNAEIIVNLPSSIYDPWLVMNINADPLTIYTGNTSKITANVFMDSNGTDHSGDASQFFSGPEVTFTTNLGNVGSKSVTVDWILGTATAILRGDEGPGTASLTATDGDQTENTTVTILQSPEVNAGSTVGMQNTGFPMAGLLLAILAVFGGLVGARKTN